MSTKIPKLVQFDRLCITWEDAQVTEGGLSITEYLKEYKPCIRRTLGFYVGTKSNAIFIAETDDRLANNFWEKPLDVERVNAIPLSMVTEIEKLG
jgi:hypothetical protein